MTATLNTIQEKAEQEKLSSPAVVVVGEVVKLQKQIQKPEDTTWHLVTKGRRSAIKVSADIKRSWI